MQQSFRSRRHICAALFCVLLPQIFMCRIFLCMKKRFNMSLLSYMSYQHHAGLQPANLVTAPTVSCSRRSDLCVVYQYMLQQPVQVSFFHITFLFHPVFRLFSTVCVCCSSERPDDGIHVTTVYIYSVSLGAAQPPAAVHYHNIIFLFSSP